MRKFQLPGRGELYRYRVLGLHSMNASLSLSHRENNCTKLTNKGETKTFLSVEDHTGVRKHRSVQNEEQQVPDACSVYMICFKFMYKVYTKAAVLYTACNYRSDLFTHRVLSMSRCRRHDQALFARDSGSCALNSMLFPEGK